MIQENDLIKKGFKYKNRQEFERGMRNIYLKKFNHIKIEYNITINDFLEMVNSVGWNTYNEEQVKKA